MTRNRWIAGIFLAGILFLTGMRLKQQVMASRTPNHRSLQLAIFSASTAVKKMDMFPTRESKKDADYAISRINAVIQTHEEQEMADNATFILKNYEKAIEEFHKQPSESNLLMLHKIQDTVSEITEIVRPQ